MRSKYHKNSIFNSYQIVDFIGVELSFFSYYLGSLENIPTEKIYQITNFFQNNKTRSNDISTKIQITCIQKVGEISSLYFFRISINFFDRIKTLKTFMTNLEHIGKFNCNQ